MLIWLLIDKLPSNYIIVVTFLPWKMLTVWNKISETEIWNTLSLIRHKEVNIEGNTIYFMIWRILWNISCETCVIKYVHFQEKAPSYKRKKFNKIDFILYFRFINYESLKQNVSEILSRLSFYS